MTLMLKCICAVVITVMFVAVAAISLTTSSDTVSTTNPDTTMNPPVNVTQTMYVEQTTTLSSN